VPGARRRSPFPHMEIADDHDCTRVGGLSGRRSAGCGNRRREQPCERS
jgi:hypothetical protein